MDDERTDVVDAPEPHVVDVVDVAVVVAAAAAAVVAVAVAQLAPSGGKLWQVVDFCGISS